MKKIIIYTIAITAILFTACNNKPQFTIKGTVSNTSEKKIYLSHIGINKTAFIDSTEIGNDGKFEFKQPRPDSYDFYRLQLNKKSPGITIAVDSVETITLTIDGKDFANSYTIEGSEESRKIQQIALLRTALEKQINHLLTNTKGNSNIEETRITIYNITKEFKENIFKQYIMPAPDKAGAYYAIFMQTNGMPLFNPNINRFDSKCFAAVATSLNNKYPESARAKNICSIAQKGMQKTRPVTPDSINVKESELTATGLFDIKLPNIKGDSISLSSLKGKVVLLDFTAYGNTKTSAHTIALRELYNKYRNENFEIYQISIDSDIHFWKTSADKLPWICVHDEEGITSPNMLLYRIEKLPSYFLINQENEIVMRDEQITDLSSEIDLLLKKKGTISSISNNN